MMNKFYFDLTKFKPITKITTYELINAVDMKLIGSGNVLICRLKGKEAARRKIHFLLTELLILT